MPLDRNHMIQFMANIVEQLDLALDQLAVCDRNFDRFALMLVDNVVELALHSHAEDIARRNDLWGHISEHKYDPKTVAKALGKYFAPKVKLARNVGLVADNLADSILYLHGFRNTSYHRGIGHDGILHSLTIFYFQNTCRLLGAYSPGLWCSHSRDTIPYRARKYLGSVRLFHHEETFDAAWIRLSEVADVMPFDLTDELFLDMKKTIESADGSIQFLVDESHISTTRKQAVIHSQSWPFAFSDKGKIFAAKNGCPELNPQAYHQWIAENYRWPVPDDPIPGWEKRLQSLQTEDDPHLALKKYCDFMKQTDSIRSDINNNAAQLDAHIQHLIDVARGK
jgi:hypothetical protein